MIARENYTGNELFWAHSETITKVIFQNELKEISNALETYDLGATNPEAIKGYLVVNEDGETHTLYLQGKNGIEASPNSKYLFFNFSILESIEGLEYLDTSEVTDMFSMFQNCTSLTNLDISGFDTRKVTNMSRMFQNCSSLVNINVNHFDTSLVTNMENMFRNCESLVNLDVSHFNTSKVTNMNYMFAENDHLITLNINGFDTNNVIDMYGMFMYSPELREIKYGENFIHNLNAITTNIYYNCPANKPTHESWNSVF